MLRLLLLVSLRGAVAFAPSPRVFGAGPRVAALRDGTVVEDLSNENAVLRNELVRKDAIIEGLLQTLSASAMNTQVNAVVHAAPLTDLCQISKEACDAVTPMLAAFYEKIADQRHGGSSKLKSDATYFTIADGIVQHMFINHLFAGNKFAQIVGEEDESVTQRFSEKPKPRAFTARSHAHAPRAYTACTRHG